MDDRAVREITEGALAKIDALNDEIRALIHVDHGAACNQADDLDHSLPPKGPLFGKTFVVKDLIDVIDQPTRAGSRLFGNHRASCDASCVSRLKAAGAVLLGKANMHELAVGGAVNPWFGQVINPISRTNGTGGTSSGSAAAVAGGFCSFALGTDSGGSNRSVAAATGLYGYKPTNGLLALDGVLPTAPTMDTVGVIAPSIEVISSCLAVLTEDTIFGEEGRLEGRTFARLTNLVASPIDAVVSDALEYTFASIVRHGGRVSEISVRSPDALASAGVAILRFEFARLYGARIDQSPENVGPAVLAFLAACRQISSSQYEEAKELRVEHQALWAEMLAGVDGFIAPTAPGLAPDLNAEMTSVNFRLMPYGAAGAEFRMWANTIGIPAIAIPLKRAAGLPASVQLAGAMHSDKLLLDLAAALGRAMTGRNAVQS